MLAAMTVYNIDVKEKKNPHKQFFTAKKAYREDEWDGSDVEDVGGWK